MKYTENSLDFCEKGFFFFSFIKLMNFSRGFIQNFNLTVVRKNVILNSFAVD